IVGLTGVEHDVLRRDRGTGTNERSENIHRLTSIGRVVDRTVKPVVAVEGSRRNHGFDLRLELLDVVVDLDLVNAGVLRGNETLLHFLEQIDDSFVRRRGNVRSRLAEANRV